MVEVSVILPNYNHEKYLKERIDSILNQTFQHFELIILDDHSQDESRQIIENYRTHPKVSTIQFNETNSGSPFKQWTRGINLAKGFYIWIAESDDSCEPTFLEKTVAKMNEYPSAGIIFCQSTEFEVETGKSFISFTGHPRFSESFKHSYFNKGRKEISEKLVYENIVPNASGVLFRKDAYYQAGGVNEDMKLCGDWFLWVKILLMSDVYFISEPLNHFRLTSVSARSKYSKLNTFHERMEILHFLDLNHIRGAGKAKLALIKSLFNNYMLTNLGKPVNTVMREKKYMLYPRLNIFCAVTLSLFDRVFNRVQLSKNLLESLNK
jgi:glycosyltransferase involved in cell wall biosynthesis